MTNAELKQRFDNMTAEEQASMRAKLSDMARSGAPIPDKGTLERYAFSHYITDPTPLYEMERDIIAATYKATKRVRHRHKKVALRVSEGSRRAV